MAKRTTVVTVETHSLTVMRGSTDPRRAWCQECAAETQMLTIEQAASLCSVSERAIFLLIENRIVHFDESHGARLLVCADSLRDVAGG